MPPEHHAADRGAASTPRRLAARAGRRDAALQIYDAFCSRLAAELGLEPLDATTRLAAGVRRGDLVDRRRRSRPRRGCGPSLAWARRNAGRLIAD